MPKSRKAKRAGSRKGGMPKTVVVKASINRRKREVTFSDSVVGVRAGDTVKWQLRSATGRLQQLDPRVKVMTFPPQGRRGRRSPFAKGSRLNANGSVITGIVGDAPNGSYGYLVDVSIGGRRVELRCLWKVGPRGPIHPIHMAGIEKPPRPSPPGH